MRRLVLLALLLLFRLASAQAQNIATQLQGALDRVATVAAETFGRSLPLPSASAGVSYAFDAVTGNFQRQPSTFGQVYLDRADPIGAKKVNVQFAYQYVNLTEIDGKDADDLRDTSGPIYFPGRLAALTFPRLGVDAALHQFLFAGTYGITDDLEVSLAIPVVYSDVHLRARLAAAGISAIDGSLIQIGANVDETTRAVGVGDILLRGKYRVIDSDPVHVSAGLLLRFPSGDVDDLSGVGFFEVAPALLASTRIYELAPWARLQGHLNASVGFNTEDVDSSEARWGIGLDWGITENVTAAVAILGRNQFARVAPAGFFDFPRCPNANLVTCASSQAARGGTAPIFGLSSGRPDYYDIAMGGRGALWRDTVFAFASVVVPLNDGFVRTAPIPLVGIEATF